MNRREYLVKQQDYPEKSPYSMNPEYVVIHNTANDAPADNEARYVVDNPASGNLSYHFAVDDIEAVQMLPLDRNGFHAGDGANGDGNRKGIAIEICYSKSGGERFAKAEENAAQLAAELLNQFGWGIDRLKKHQDFSGKYCPHRTLDMGWDRFVAMVQAHMGGTKPAPQPNPEPAPTQYQVGDHVRFSTCYKASTDPISAHVVPSKGFDHGVITKILSGTSNPYLINNGQCWVNDGDIRGYYEEPAAKPPITVGSTVRILSSASHYATGQAIPSRFRTGDYTDSVLQLNADGTKALLKNIYSWVWTKDLQRV